MQCGKVDKARSAVQAGAHKTFKVHHIDGETDIAEINQECHKKFQFGWSDHLKSGKVSHQCSCVSNACT